MASPENNSVLWEDILLSTLTFNMNHPLWLDDAFIFIQTKTTNVATDNNEGIQGEGCPCSLFLLIVNSKTNN